MLCEKNLEELRFTRTSGVTVFALSRRDASRRLFVSRTSVGLNRMGLIIWAYLMHGLTPNEIAGRIRDDCGGHLSKCKARVMSLVENLLPFGVISIDHETVFVLNEE